MVRLLEDRRGAVDLRARVDQVDGVELVPAVVALVAASRLVAADRARPLDVPVGKRVAGGGREGAQGRLLDDVALLVERAEEVLHDAVVIRRRRAREQVVREAQVAQVLADELAVAVGGLTRGQPLAVGGDHHRRAVLVGAADHQDVVASKPVIPGDDVGGHSEPGHMAQMPRATRVGPRDGDEDALWLAVREVGPPCGARSRTSYGGAAGPTVAEWGPWRVADRRVRPPGARGRRLPSGRGGIASDRPAWLGRQRAERQQSREPPSGPGEHVDELASTPPSTRRTWRRPSVPGSPRQPGWVARFARTVRLPPVAPPASPPGRSRPRPPFGDAGARAARR